LQSGSGSFRPVSNKGDENPQAEAVFILIVPRSFRARSFFHGSPPHSSDIQPSNFAIVLAGSDRDGATGAQADDGRFSQPSHGILQHLASLP